MRVRAKKASPGGKLAPQATEGERESLGLNCYSQTDNRTVLPAAPLQSLRDSFPPGDAFFEFTAPAGSPQARPIKKSPVAEAFQLFFIYGGGSKPPPYGDDLKQRLRHADAAACFAVTCLAVGVFALRLNGTVLE